MSEQTGPQQTGPHPTGPRPPTPDVVWRTGPTPFTVVLGLACLTLAGLFLAGNLHGVVIDWAVAGPSIVLGLGAVLVLLGVFGLVRRPR